MLPEVHGVPVFTLVVPRLDPPLLEEGESPWLDLGSLSDGRSDFTLGLSTMGVPSARKLNRRVGCSPARSWEANCLVGSATHPLPLLVEVGVLRLVPGGAVLALVVGLV